MFCSRYDDGIMWRATQPKSGRERRRERVGALVERHPDVEREDRAVVRDGGVDVDPLVARVGGRGHVLDPVLDPTDRPPEPLRGHAQGEVLAPHRRLLAEGAPHVRRDHAQPVERVVEDACEVEAKTVRRLIRRVERELAGAGVVVGNPAAALHRHHRHALRPQRKRHDPGALKCTVRVAEGLLLGVEDVRRDVVEDRRDRRVEGMLDRRDRRQRVVVDLDRVAAVLGGVAASRRRRSRPGRP